MRRRWNPILLVVALPTAAWAQGRTGGSTQAQMAVQKADAAFAEKRMKDAIRLYLQALSIQQNLPAAHEKLAIAYYATKQYRKAIPKLQMCLRVSPSSAKCHLWLGKHRIKLGQTAAGIKHLQDAVKQDWKLPLAMRTLGIWYYKKGRYRKAEKALWTFLKFRDKSWPKKVDFPMHVLLGRTYLALNQHPAAQTQFSKALKIKGQSKAAKLGLANAYIGRGYFNDALNLYLGLKELWPKKPRIHFNLARCFYRLRRKRKALEHLQRYRAKRPKDVQAIVLQGDIHFFFKEHGPALAAYKRATEAAPNAVEPRLKYATALLATQKSGKALRLLTAARKRWPKNPKVLLALGEAQLQQKKTAAAIATLGELLEARPSSVEGLLLRGQAYLAEKKIPQAVVDFKRAHKLAPKRGKVRRALVRALNRAAYQQLEAGKDALAVTTLKEAFALDPKRMFTNLNLGIVYLRTKKYEAALRHLNTVHSKLPRNFTANRLLGRLYYEKGKLQVARGHYLKARQVSRRLASSAQASVEIELGALLAAQGEIDSAVDVLKSAVSNSAGVKSLSSLAQGNLAIALLDRGYRRLQKNKGDEALADLELAKSYAKHLKGNQPALLRFLLAMAYLEAGRWTKANQAFRKISGRRMLKKVLNPPYDRLGVRYFRAYTRYRQGGLEAAATQMRRLMRGAPAKIRGRIREVIRSAYELRGTQLLRRGRHRQAQKMFRTARTYGLSPQGQHNLAVSYYRSGKQGRALRIWKGGGMPATALCNLGTYYDNAGNPKLAYKYYTRCKRAGGATGDIAKRISTIKRIFGY